MRKMWKKTAAVMMAAGLACTSLSACSNEKDDKESTTEEVEGTKDDEGETKGGAPDESTAAPTEEPTEESTEDPMAGTEPVDGCSCCKWHWLIFVAGVLVGALAVWGVPVLMKRIKEKYTKNKC